MNWLEKLRLEHLDSPENILFVLGIIHQGLHHGILDYVSEFKDADLVGNLLFTMDGGKIVLKEEYMESEYHKFVNFLKKYGMGPDGHLANPQDYSIGITSLESKREFELLKLEYPDMDLEYVAEKVARFYETGTRTKFPRFFQEAIRLII